MKYVHSVSVVAFALVLVACGGTGSGGSTHTATTTTTNNIPTGAHIECVVLAPTTFDNGTLSDGQQFIYQDPEDIESQDQVQFELVYYDANGRHVLPATGWGTSDTANIYGTITFDDGIFIASNSQTSTAQAVSCVYSNTVFSAQYEVLPRQVRLRGVVTDSVTKAGLSGVEVDFYGPQNPNVAGSAIIFTGRVISAIDGSFRASIPSYTTAFTLVNKTLPAGFERFIQFDGGYYATSQVGCYSPLPAYPVGEQFMIDYTNPKPQTNGTILLLPSSVGEPPDLACSAFSSARPKKK